MVMLTENYELLVNPPQELWNEVVAVSHDELAWKMSFHDYPTYFEGYGRENFKFLVAVDKATGQAASCICGTLFPSVKGSREVFTIGMYYTHPDHRSTGLGRKMFSELMKIAGYGNMFLNSAPDMAQKYAQRSGFDKFAPWELKVLVAHGKDSDLTRIDVDPNVKVVDLASVDFDQLVEYDLKICGRVYRRKFLEKFLTQPESWNKIAVDDTGCVIGYCNARIVFGNHVVLGPFYADSTEIAATLFRRTLELVPDLSSRHEIMTLLPHSNTDGIDMFSKMADGKVETEMSMPRQFTKSVIDTPSEKVFSITEYDTSFV